jgi:NAD(P)-dependent dehydrogenase (short-subunit alcohol dehydrogenase family)
LIIGGSGGIGRELALGLRSAGAKLLVAGRNEDRLAAVAAELEQPDAGQVTYAVDARSVDALNALAGRIAEEHGAPQILINCQGTIAIKPAFEMTEEEYDAILDTNLKSVFFACQAFGRHMVNAGGGVIINISSLSAHTGWANAAIYGASKWGVAGLTQSLAAEWGEAGLRVNAIAPGFFLTDLNRERMSEERKAEARRRSAMQRMGELPELVGAAIYLASDAARFVSGATLRVDGGYLSSGI